MAAHLIRTSLGMLAMLLCAVVAGAIAAFVPISQDLHGSDYWLLGAIMAGLICAAATVLRSRLQWPVIDLMASLVSAEAFALCVIASFSGLTGLHLLDPFNRWWLGTVSLFIVSPWLAGVLIGGFVPRRRSR
jgi:hypothetical protein